MRSELKAASSPSATGITAGLPLAPGGTGTARLQGTGVKKVQE